MENIHSEIEPEIDEKVDDSHSGRIEFIPDYEQAIENTLNSEQFFFCERFRCRLMKIRCVTRQNRIKQIQASGLTGKGVVYRAREHYTDSLLDCLDCEQGKSIANEIRKGGR